MRAMVECTNDSACHINRIVVHGSFTFKSQHDVCVSIWRTNHRSNIRDDRDGSMFCVWSCSLWQHFASWSTKSWLIYLDALHKNVSERSSKIIHIGTMDTGNDWHTIHLCCIANRTNRYSRHDNLDDGVELGYRC